MPFSFSVLTSEPPPDPFYDGNMAPGSNSLAKFPGPLDKIKFITGTEQAPSANEDNDLIFDIKDSFLVRVKTWNRLTEQQIINRFKNENYPVVIYFIPNNQNFVELIAAFPTYSERQYMINNTVWQPYTGKIKITHNGIIYIKHSESLIIRLAIFLKSGDKPYINAILSLDKRSYLVSIDYKEYPSGFFRTGAEVYFKPYTGPFTVTANTVVYAYGVYQNIVSETSVEMLYGIFVPRPIISFAMAGDRLSALVNIDYNDLPLRLYKTDEDISWAEYTGLFAVNKNTIIYAKAGFDSDTFSFISMLPIEQII